MKAKLIKVNDIYTLMDGDKMIASSDSDFQTDYEVMKLSKENCNEISGVVDSYPAYMKDSFIQIYKDGFNKAMELNKDKLFTLEEVMQAFLKGQEMQVDYFSYKNSLQQPTEIEIEIEMENYGYCEGCRKAGMWHCAHADTCGYAETRERPKLDENDCLILKKK
jgi:hypothetical protein